MSIIADLIRAGVDPDLVARVADEIAAARALGHQECVPQTSKTRVNDVSAAQWNQLRQAAFERDGFACVYCGSIKRLECDHIMPRSRGGPSLLGNLATSCKSCNASKRDLTPQEWGGR